ncbi:MAG: (d)CMP kinase [Muribaculaceae bacterium]|nr:(d)CMP kinase [Muribaculaceae bacterium]
MNNPIIIAIDGYSSSGKSTISRYLASEIGYRYIDSGAMYRAVTLYALRAGLIDAAGNINVEALTAALPSIHIDFKVNPGGKQSTMLNGEDVEAEIRRLEVAEHVSPVAAIPAVRHALVARQQAMGAEKGIVMDGRDIGTTVFPHAEMKVFITAAPEERARRRMAELEAKGEHATYEEVLHNVNERDHIDRTRAESPLRQAPDAVLLDNTHMAFEEQNQFMLDLFHKITRG